MPWLAEIVLFATPFALYALWRRLRPGEEPAPRTLWLALAGILLGAGLAVTYGLARRMESGSVYVPARLAPDGHVEPGHPGSRS